MITRSVIIMDDGFTLICGDCLDVLPALSGELYAVIDPPYGIGENNRKNLSRARPSDKWRNPRPIDYGDFDWDYTRNSAAVNVTISKAVEAVVFGGNYYTDILPPSPGWIIWDKVNSGDFADCEMAWTSYNRAARMFRYLWNGFQKAKPETRYHPTQKPLALMEWVIANYTPPGCTVLDSFMGSGTTGVACARLGRRFIGIEKDPGYFEIASKRINAARAQLRFELEV